MKYISISYGTVKTACYNNIRPISHRIRIKIRRMTAKVTDVGYNQSAWPEL